MGENRGFEKGNECLTNRSKRKGGLWMGLLQSDAKGEGAELWAAEFTSHLNNICRVYPIPNSRLQYIKTRYYHVEVARNL